jgi:hypothetical protein
VLSLSVPIATGLLRLIVYLSGGRGVVKVKVHTTEPAELLVPFKIYVPFEPFVIVNPC